jgi:hypothetical protein
VKHHAFQTDHRYPERGNRWRALAAPIACGLITVGLLTACSSGSASPSVAHVTSSSAAPVESSSALGSTTPAESASPASASPTASGKPDAIAYSRCMRSHGVPDYPDPDAAGQAQIKGAAPLDLDPNSAGFKAAAQACKALAPPRQTSPDLDAARQAARLRFAKCMRAQGVSGFPDPSTGSGGSPKQSDLDITSPIFVAAQKVCQKELGQLPAPGPGGAG